MQNKLIDLNNHLFTQMERLCDESTCPDAITKELARSRAVTDVAKRIIENGRLALDALKANSEYTGALKELPLMLQGENGKEK